MLAVVAAAMAFSSCEDPALSGIYGDTLVYMPQAAHNLGIDNNLNFKLVKSKVDENALHQSQTTLGIYRSSTAPKESFSVDLKVDADSLLRAQTIAQDPDAESKYNIYKSAVLLDEKYYEPLPEKLTVKNGERQATTQLILKDADLYKDYSIGQILCLPVRIENPTKYQLNENLSFTMVVITLGE